MSSNGEAPRSGRQLFRQDEHGNVRLELRHEDDGTDVRHLDAYLDDAGNLHLDGQDLGPGTAMVSDDGEYEWYETISSADVPRLLDLLGEPPDADVMKVLALSWCHRSHELERLVHESDIPVVRQVW